MKTLCLVAVSALFGAVNLEGQTPIFDNFLSGNVIGTNTALDCFWQYNSTSPSASYGGDGAEMFSVPSNSNFVLNSVTLGLALQNGPDYSNFAVDLLSDNSGSPGTLIQTLATGTSLISTTKGPVTFTAPNGIDLTGGLNYWIELKPPTISTSSNATNISVSWYLTSSFAGVTSTYAGQSLDASGNAGPWDIVSGYGPTMLIEASATPEPSTCATLLCGLGLLAFGLAGRRILAHLRQI